MKELPVEQNTLAWVQARLGVITASELDALVTPDFAIRKGDGVATYAARKIAERWTMTPERDFHGGAMENGSILEDEARPWLADFLETDIRRPGFVLSDDGVCGCSPDGLNDGGGCGVEIKCPLPHTHVRWLLDGGVPKDHRAQVHGGMYVTGFSRWLFVSYVRKMPPVLVWVERDEKIMAAIEEAVAACSERIETDYRRLVTANGGREPVRRVPVPVEPEGSFVF